MYTKRKMTKKIAFALAYPDDSGQKFKFAEVEIERPSNLILHLTTLSFDQLKIVLKNLLMTGRPLNSKYTISKTEFLHNDTHVVPKLRGGKKPFRSGFKSKPRRSKRLLIIYQILRHCPFELFDLNLKFLTVTELKSVLAIPHSMRIHRLSKKGLIALRKHKSQLNYNTFYQKVPNLPLASDLSVPKEWYYRKFVRNLDLLLGRSLNDPAKYAPTNSVPKQLFALDHALERYAKHW